MAGGKTYHGLGEIEAGFRDEALEGEESRGAHSGPTVVDAVKVEEGLEELRRTLDSPAAGRPTAVGHSSGTSLVRQTIAPDPLRGTMFGHSIHLPDVNTPDDLPDEPAAVSGSLEPIDPSAPVHLSPFPLADALSTGLAISQAEPAARPPPRLDPFRRHEGVFAAPDEETDQVVAPRRSLFGRAVLAVAGLGLVGVIVAFLIRGNDADEAWTPPPPSTAATSSSPANPTPTPTPAAAATPTPSLATSPPTAEPPEPAARPPVPAAEAPAPTAAKPPEPEPGIEPRPVRKRRASRRAVSGEEPAAEATRPVKPVPIIDDDPDATLPPSALD